jgi:hypothetical protein
MPQLIYPGDSGAIAAETVAICALSARGYFNPVYQGISTLTGGYLGRDSIMYLGIFGVVWAYNKFLVGNPDMLGRMVFGRLGF